MTPAFWVRAFYAMTGASFAGFGNMLISHGELSLITGAGCIVGISQIVFWERELKRQ